MGRGIGGDGAGVWRVWGGGLAVVALFLLLGQVVLYDEPTAGLDPIASTVVEELICSVHIKGEDVVGLAGKTASYIVVTHQHSTIQRAVDRLIFLYEGKIVWEGLTHEFTSSTSPIVQQFASGSLEGPIKY
ncbi:protein TRIGALACTOSYLDIACYLGLYCEROL 3, chloroplastic-like [Chenopodium quinoa]|uniref:protein TRIGALACTOSYLDIACYLGLYCEROL 3, chloroplastic-like n=1 Tax=Chenopodium quinoa TaxID=63459 RepID=UPI000B797A15|nr:protein TRIGALACTOSYLDIACYLGLYCEROL 3, chloroplastic-like [Chenopodium quinoa]